jgi:hypothetical protein
VPKDGLEESEKNYYIAIGPVTGGPKGVSQHSKSKFLGHLEGGWWFQGRHCVGNHGRDLNCGGTLGVESLYVATPLALVAMDLHPIACLSLARGCDYGSRRTINLSESACASQDALRPAILEERTNIDCSHHDPFSSFRLVYAEALKKAREGGGEVVKLDIGKEHPVQKYKKF